MRSLWPREHGAYVQLAAPLVAALASARPTATAFLLAAGACFAFVANEPLLVLLGHRGPRLREARGRDARWRLAITAGGALVCAVLGLAWAPRAVLAMAGVAAVPLAVMMRLAWTKSVHSVVGELVAAVALPGAAAPVAIASGIAWPAVALVWGAWALGYASSVVAVHEILRRQRRLAIRVGLAAYAIAVAAVAVRVPAIWVAVPITGLGAVLGARPPAAKRVRAIGVALVVASTASAVLTASVAL